MAQQTVTGNDQKIWCWQSSTGFRPYDKNISTAISQLKIGGTYTMTTGAKKYIITRTSNDAAKQMNVETNFSRHVIFKSINNSTNSSIQNNGWYWQRSNGNYSAYENSISSQLDNLQIGQVYTITLNNQKYNITKLSHNKCEQMNVQNGYKRNVIYQSTHNKNTNDMKDNNDSKEDCSKWYWQTSGGQYKPMSDDISTQLNALQIGNTKTIKINHSNYEFKKSSNTHCMQKNVRSNKVRNIRIAEYGWFYLSSDKSLKPYAKDLNDKLNNTQIGGKVYFTLNNTTYCVKRVTVDTGSQKNISNGYMRDAMRKMTLNKINNDVKSGVYSTNGLHKKQIEKMFYSSVSSAKYKVVKVEEIANNFTLDIYDKILESKCKNGQKQKDQERLLWHGTKNINNLKLIIANGFDRSFNATAAYGKGTYFARDAIYSVHGGYCGHDNMGIHYILLCKVITGEYVVGTSSMNTIPKKTNGTEYESLVNNVNDPSVFVIWRDYHAVPYFLVKYKKK